VPIPELLAIGHKFVLLLTHILLKLPSLISKAFNFTMREVFNVFLTHIWFISLEYE
jgi:hypothetical protein